MSERAKLIEKIIDSVENDHKFGRAGLVFLDAIEKNQTRMIEVIQSVPREIPSALKEASDAFSSSMSKVLEDIKMLSNENEKEPDDMKPIMESVRESVSALSNTIVVSLNKVSTEISRQTERVIKSNDEIIAVLTKPKKWKMTPDRNYQTKLIQEVIIEQVGG
jgi:hypothetical protein